MHDESIAVEMAQIRAQVDMVAKNVEDIQTSVKQIITLDKTIAELAVYSTQTKETLSGLQNRSEEVRDWMSRHEAQSLRDEARIIELIDRVDEKLDAVVNKGRGALYVGGLLFTISQAMITFAVSWTFSHVNEADSMNRVIAYRVEQLEHKNGK
jgi:hypothetical protein